MAEKETKPSRAKKRKKYVKYDTIWNAVGGGFSNPNQSAIFKVGKHKVLLSRAEKLDRYGNPVHTATVINSDGSLGKSCRTNGSATLAVSGALKKCGVQTKYPRV